MNSTSSERAQAVAASEVDSRWASVVARDPNADGTFYYSVKTTGVYCRPSCAARLARRENVRFHSSRQDAEAAGFRPCRRCKPDEPSLPERHAAMVADACRLIEQSEEMPTLKQLAGRAGMSVYHFHRVFKSLTGLTAHHYAMANRARRVRTTLGASSTVTQAIYDAGYNSNGRFYEGSDEILGMTPSSYRKGGARVQIHFAVGECSLGSILIAASQRGVCAILIGDDPEALTHDLQDQFPDADLIGGDAEFEQLAARVVGFVEAPALGLDLPLDIRGSAFQQRVWQALQKIPLGATSSYSEIASRIGLPKSARAVARACSANFLAVAIPCHRVVRLDGALSGYRWGVERKRTLLEREARQLADMADMAETNDGRQE